MANDNRTLFLTDQGQRYRRNTLSGKVKRYLQQAGIHKTGACHLLRHAMATHMLDNGADVRYIQAILGHADLNTTQIYTQVSIEKLKAVHSQTHPGNKHNTKTDKQRLLALLNDEGDDEFDEGQDVE